MSKKLTEKNIIRLIREEYKKRLATVLLESELKETDMYDKRGNQLLAQGLKVRHKASGYEYTVDHVDGEGDDAIIYLRHPDQPRFESAPISESGTTINLRGVDFGRITGGEPSGSEIEQVTSHKVDAEKETDLKLPHSSLLAVKKPEFEKEYEVE
jgi:hypothetical protein